jgi:hypothetical protein
MRIFQDGRTGSIRIIARDEAEHARSLADDDGADGPQVHTRGGRPVVTLAMPSSRASEEAGAGRVFPDVSGRD